MEKQEVTKGYLFSNQALSRLIIPLLVEQFLAMAVGMVDTFMVSSVGESAVSAVSLVDTIMLLIIAIFAALATGGAVVAGQYIGKKREEMSCKAGEQLVLSVFSISICIMGLIYAFKYGILHGLFGNIDKEVMKDAKEYLMVVGASIPFIAVYNSGAALFRAMGNSKISMKVSLLMNGINVGGNAILIYGFGMGVTGVAWPTLISRMVAAVVIIWLLQKQSLTIHMSKDFWKGFLHPVKQKLFQWHLIQKICQVGIPNGVENGMFQMGKLILLSLISSFGTSSITANAVSNTIAGIAILPGQTLGLAMITVVSQCVGAGDKEQTRYYVKKLMKIAVAGMIVVNVSMIFARGGIIDLYHLSNQTAELTSTILLMHSVLATVIWPFSFTLPNALRAANDATFTMIVGCISMWVFRLGSAYLIGGYFKMGVIGVWIAMFIDWTVRSILFILRTKKRFGFGKIKICTNIEK